MLLVATKPHPLKHAHPLVALVGEVPDTVDGDMDPTRNILSQLLELLRTALLRSQLAGSISLVVFAGKENQTE